MDTTAGQGLYPQHRCKTLHLVDNLRKHVKASGLSNKIELVITSPLTRTMQTAVGAFGGDDYTDGIDVAPLMVADAANSGRPAISSLNCPPFLAVELCREHLIESDEDTWWQEDIRETNDKVAARGMKFLKWLWTRKEKEIAIVSHSGFLFHTLSAFGKDCHQSVKDEICTHFANCELRSMVLVDRGMISSDSPATNFPGKVPNGPDLPNMDTEGQGLYPEHHCKTLHSTAQGCHNKDPKNFSPYDYLDASLTPLVDYWRKHIQDSGLSKKIELLITSPLTRSFIPRDLTYARSFSCDLSRTMQTAVGAFGHGGDTDGGDTDGIDATTLMVADAANSGRPAISESDEDTWWEEDKGETEEDILARGIKFMKWSWTWKEKEIAIVSHYCFSFHTLRAFGNDCHQVVKDEICEGFANCELCSMVFIDKA
ncbi:hypothetical protein Cgig2_008287 [Carnegiea gigantea]|uniref:Phosphoglycerate mutase-like protein n=1 Tax=Carnegiea gigantea TaxID=171969 RepID=A0A9Q1QS45_9CARY|nr:hypothetical protein Cgig2_008287 [Carnegiea gigantea]